jgi:hypothetical protein
VTETTAARDRVPTVSVLVPCWNAAASIARALESVLAERAVELEIVVVDDASTDGTAAVAASIAERDARVRLLRLDANGGVSNARNRGLELVRGEWLTLLDADDRLRPGAIRTLHEAATRTDALAVVGQQVWSGRGGTWYGPLYDNPDIRCPGRKSLAAAPGLLYFVSPHAKLLHRSTFEGLRFEGRVLGDQPWVIRALLRAGDRIEVIDSTVYEWIRTPPAGGGRSITATTRASVQHGIEAASIASRALAAVRDEVQAQVMDPADRLAILATYTGRLMRSDLAAHVAQALARRDPAIGALFAAIERFIAAAPAPWLRATDALARDMIEPPLQRWNRVPVAAKPAYWSLATAAIAADPDLAGRASTRLTRLALGLVLGRPGTLRRSVGIGLMMASGIGVRVASVPTVGRRAIRRFIRRT